MASQDLHSNIKTQVAVHFGSYNTITPDPLVGVIIDTNPTGADETGYESLEFVWITGVILGALGSYKLAFTHGDTSDLSDGVTVPAEFLLGNTEKVFRIDENHKTNRVGYVGKKRYVRCDITVPEVGSELVTGVLAVLSNPRSAPRPPEYPIT